MFEPPRDDDRTHLIDAGNRVQCPFDRVGDLRLHLGRSRTRIVCRNRDRRQIDLRKSVNAKRKKAETADDRQKQHDNGRKDRTMYTNFS